MKRVLLAAVWGFWAAAVGADEPAILGSYLYKPSYQMWDAPEGPPVAYLPQPGDVMLATDRNKFWKITHDLAGAGEPHNSALVVTRRDGSLAILEAGPNDTFWVRRLDLLPHLQEYCDKGPVWIRKRKTPLTADQVCRLMEFAEAQDGKRFALIRLGGQLTPFRMRGPFRTEYVGKPSGHRFSYFCSELVTESLTWCGALDPTTVRPAATYPHDLFFDHSHNRIINRHPPLICDWEPPARWTDCPTRCLPVR